MDTTIIEMLREIKRTEREIESKLAYIAHLNEEIDKERDKIARMDRYNEFAAKYPGMDKR